MLLYAKQTAATHKTNKMKEQQALTLKHRTRKFLP